MDLQETFQKKSFRDSEVLSDITPSRYSRQATQWPLTLWLTGYSASGKSTLANTLQSRLAKTGYAAFVLDGDQIRHGLNRDLGFSEKDRGENIRRVAEVARLMNNAGLIIISALISPYRRDRESARTIIGHDKFVEIHISTSLANCEKRDPKGLYCRARMGELLNFTGIDAPYEPPEAPALALDTANLALEICVNQMMRLIQEHQHKYKNG